MASSYVYIYLPDISLYLGNHAWVNELGLEGLSCDQKGIRYDWVSLSHINEKLDSQMLTQATDSVSVLLTFNIHIFLYVSHINYKNN